MDFEGGEVSVTNRKTGETTVNPDKEPFSFFNQIDRVDQDKVIAELEKFKNSENVIGFSPSELIVAVDQKREELSKEIMEAKKRRAFRNCRRLKIRALNCPLLYLTRPNELTGLF